MVRILPLHPSLTNKKYQLIAGGIVLMGAAAVTYVVARPKPDTSSPTYDVVLPVRRTAEDLGGWRRTSPADSEPVYAYSDEIDDTGIIVSQQPIPDQHKGNVADWVEKVAKGFSATTVIEAGGTDVYIGRSARGPQSLIFTKNNVLILIKSQKTISQEAWVQYINSLVDPNGQQIPTF